jgi:hypothetical protein
VRFESPRHTAGPREKFVRPVSVTVTVLVTTMRGGVELADVETSEKSIVMLLERTLITERSPSAEPKTEMGLFGYWGLLLPLQKTAFMMTPTKPRERSQETVIRGLKKLISQKACSRDNCEWASNTANNIDVHKNNIDEKHGRNIEDEICE